MLAGVVEEDVDHPAAGTAAPAVPELAIPASGGPGARKERAARPGIRAAEVTVMPPGDEETRAEPPRMPAVSANGTGATPPRERSRRAGCRSRPGVRRGGRPTPSTPRRCWTGTAEGGPWRPGSGPQVRHPTEGPAPPTAWGNASPPAPSPPGPRRRHHHARAREAG